MGAASVLEYLADHWKPQGRIQSCLYSMPAACLAQAGLMQQLALIQGPPGTGKTYLGIQLMRALLHNLAASELPVLCVCYTNHALDQFLEGVKLAGLIEAPEEMIRIGSK